MTTPLPYTPSNWYWIVAGSTTQVYSSAAAAYVTLPDATYTAWLAAGGNPSLAATEADLWAVLAAQYPAGIAAGNVPGQEAIAARHTDTDNYFTLADNVDATKKLRWQLSGIATGTIRTWTAPDADITIVGTTNTQTLGNKTFVPPLDVSGADANIRLINTGAAAVWNWQAMNSDNRLRLYEAIGVAEWLSVSKTDGSVALASGTSSTASTTGALRVTGGVGVGGAINAGGAIRSSSPSAGIGYATGAGGSVTQLTSKATAVTVNAVCGKVITHNASLAANTAVGFTINNSALLVGDALILTQASTGSMGAYAFTGVVWNTGAGTITIRNLTAGALAENVEIQFAILRQTIS